MLVLVLVSGFVIVVLLVLVVLAVIVTLMLGGAIIHVMQMVVVAIDACVMLVLKAQWRTQGMSIDKANMIFAERSSMWSDTWTEKW